MLRNQTVTDQVMRTFDIQLLRFAERAKREYILLN